MTESYTYTPAYPGGPAWVVLPYSSARCQFKAADHVQAPSSFSNDTKCNRRGVAREFVLRFVNDIKIERADARINAPVIVTRSSVGPHASRRHDRVSTRHGAIKMTKCI